MAVWIVQMAGAALPPATSGEGELRLPVEDAPDVTGAGSSADIRRRLAVVMPDAAPEVLARLSERYWRYAHGVHAEDILAIPLQGAVVFAEALGPARFETGGYVLPVRWFARRVALSRFGRHREAFTRASGALTEVQDAAARKAIREKLPLKANRFRHWKWIILVVVAIRLAHFAVQLWREDTGAF